MKVALLGGSFNPVHNGHLEAARAVLKHTDCGEVWFLPCHFHPFKKNKGFATEKERVEMLRLALKGNRRLRLSLFEIELGREIKKETRTLETVKRIRKKYPGREFCWVIGSNLVREMKRWAGFPELVKSIRFVVVPIRGRKGWRGEKWLAENKAVILPQNAAVQDISSSRVRGLVAGGKGISGMVPSGVLSFIAENMLYLPAGEFTRRVYRAAMRIPEGRVSTYGELARAAGGPNAARAAGNAMHRNPYWPIVPCHRVVKSSGEPGGFGSGPAEKLKLLKSEGICVIGGKIEKFNKLIVKAEKFKKLNVEN